MSTALLIFIKNPEPGKVKTRLAASVGNQKALEIYQQLLTHTRETTLALKTNRYLYYSSFVDHEDEWSAEAFHKLVQEEGDLGQRMSEAFADAFEQHDRVVIIGSDCKELTPQIVNQAFTKLEQFDFVVGPALDGGYYLLGMRSFHPEVFSGVAWSNEHTLKQTLGKILGGGGSVYLLPELSDVDYLEDWERVK